MKTILELIPEYVRSLAGYVAGKPVKQAQRESGISMIKLASNENPLGPSPRALEAIRAAMEELNFYPDNDGAELRWALAERHNLLPEQIFIADGSNALLDIICRTLLGPGLNCISSERSFISYPIFTHAAQGDYIAIPTKNHGYDLDAIAAAINEQTRIVILSNPNNPTGTVFDADATEAFLRRVPEHVLVVLDEAYFEFGQHFATLRGETYSRSLDYVRSGRLNVIVLRTFSKTYGLAGIRLGYACGHPELLKYIARLRTSFSISALAEAAGLGALKDSEHVRRTLENNAEGAALLMDGLSEMGMHPVPTNTNFIYFETHEDANQLASKLQAEGIIVRSLVPWGIPHGIRVTIGAPEHNQHFLRALRKSISQTAMR
jgi:histidinol-phosphate aminotransferase